MKKRNTVFDCSVIELPKIQNRAGNITPVHSSHNVPFDIKRIYYLYDVPGGESRGGHAHVDLQQLIVAASGSFDILLDDGVNKKVVNLNRPYYGLLMPSGIWRELLNFSSGAICLVLASMYYTEDDYIREYKDYQEYVKSPSLI